MLELSHPWACLYIRAAKLTRLSALLTLFVLKESWDFQEASTGLRKAWCSSECTIL